ncbi:MAG: hypothetical protein HC773_03490 [Scytonema sp. CRU_2_7]|nr:hypothetical protein [Scytonema sp. CRU_2_7]
MSLQIYEFSRELIDISQKNGKYVSGGFGSEVGRFHHPVPEKIKDAVNRGDFRINDNYPPHTKLQANMVFRHCDWNEVEGSNLINRELLQQQEYALVAREIDEYSVLAVASGAIDDKNRPLVVYRYFWLSKPEENIDGIGVLLKWWLNAGKPKFEFLETHNSNELSYSVRELSGNFDSKNCEPLNPQLVEKLAEIKLYPFPFRANQSTEFTCGQLHSLALHLQKQYNIPLAWAWNVRRLEYPERFDLIYCVDEIYPCIVNNIHQREKSLKATPNDKPSVQSVPQKVQPDEKTYGEIKKCLLNIAKTDSIQREQYLKQLTQYIKKYPINQWNWKSLIEEEMTEEPSSLAKARYIALLVIFGQRRIHEWLYWLRKQRNVSFQFSSLYLQKK